MTVSMTAKNQITIPKKIADLLHLKRGSMFDVEVHKNRIELIPLEIKEMKFSDEIYEKLEALSERERGREKKVTKRFINKLKKGRV